MYFQQEELVKNYIFYNFSILIDVIFQQEELVKNYIFYNFSH